MNVIRHRSVSHQQPSRQVTSRGTASWTFRAQFNPLFFPSAVFETRTSDSDPPQNALEQSRLWQREFRFVFRSRPDSIGHVNKHPITVPSLLLAVLVGCSTAEAEVPQVPNAVTPVPGVVAAGRLQADDLDGLKQAGIRHIIDLTLDAETPHFNEAKLVRAAGMRYSNLPLRGAADLTRDNVIAFDELMLSAERPVLVHCSSANRVGAIAALRAAWVEGKSEEEAIAIGKAWGLKALEPDVRERIRSNLKSGTSRQ
jgi:uncharacterized protein (TIGR01244 family)